MQPYVIRQGDYILKLAYTLGFDADAVWNDIKNADLRTLRLDPNTLAPGDVLYIPDQPSNSQAPAALTTGATNTFVADVPTATVTIKFTEATFASQACTVYELDHLTHLTTDGVGVLTFPAPVTLDVVTVVFTDLHFACSCAVGCLDPLDTTSGVFQRLQNLGYIDQAVTFEATNLGLVRGALRALKAGTAGGNDAAPSSSSSSTSDDSPENAKAPADASFPESGDPPDQEVPDDGLTDQGQLDDKTRALLLAAHGC